MANEPATGDRSSADADMVRPAIDLRNDRDGAGRDAGVDRRGRVERRYPPRGPAGPLSVRVRVHVVDGDAGRVVALAQGRAVRALLTSLLTAGPARPDVARADVATPEVAGSGDRRDYRDDPA